LGAVLQRVESVLQDVHAKRELQVDVHAAWQVLHGVLAYGHDFQVNHGGTNVDAVKYLLAGGQLEGWEFTPGATLPNGRLGLRAILRPGSFQGQGHTDQWLAILAQCQLPLDQELVVRGRTYQLADYLAQVQHDVAFNVEEEWSWSLIALTNYLKTSESWQAGDGANWSIERLVEAEISQELASSACGGTHRLIGVSMTLNRRYEEQEKISGVWLQAQQYLLQAANLVHEFQNGDGSFSTNYFHRPGVSADLAQVLATTGHTLEFLAITLPPEQLREEWILRAVDRLCDVLIETEDLLVDCGALYHAVHGLVIFREKVSST
jgi:hypothetical protein